VSDEFTVPLCRLHHRELHRSRNEPLWWKTARIDPIRIARELWEATRPSDKSSAPSVSLVLPASTDETPKRGAAPGGQAAPDAAAETSGQ
jgi:hypothetical protein